MPGMIMLKVHCRHLTAFLCLCACGYARTTLSVMLICKHFMRKCAAYVITTCNIRNANELKKWCKQVLEVATRYKGQCLLTNVKSRKHVLHKRYYFFILAHIYEFVCVYVWRHSSLFLPMCWLQIINQYLLLTCCGKIERKWSLWFMTQSVCA